MHILTRHSDGYVEVGSLARYAPFGDWRTEPTTNPTLSGRGYTGHRHNNTGANDLGLIYMRARFYVPSIGRFASADTIVPEPTSPQSFNRYSYVRNNPLRRIDPSGHIECAMLGADIDVRACNATKTWNGSSRYFYSDYANGTYFDRSHINGGVRIGSRIIDSVRNAVANGGGRFTIPRRQKIPGTKIVAATYAATYQVSGDIAEDEIIGVALAIYMDFEFGWELWQAAIPVGNGQESAFAIEDFPSDYIGFMAAALELDPPTVLAMLGSVEAAAGPPKSRCIGPVCDRFDLKNWGFSGFTPKTPADGRWENVPWPEALQLDPTNDASLWSFQHDATCPGGQTTLCINHDFVFDSPWDN